jgi:TPR repeat protein
VSAQLGEGNPFDDMSADTASPAPTRVVTKEENNDASRAQLEEKAQSGVAPAQTSFAMLLEQENKLSEAISWYRKAAEHGDGEGMRHLGLCYWSGQGVEKNPREAISWWKQAADKGNEEAKKNLKMALEKFDESGQARQRK